MNLTSYNSYNEKEAVLIVFNNHLTALNQLLALNQFLASNHLTALNTTLTRFCFNYETTLKMLNFL